VLQARAKKLIYEYVKNHLEKTNNQAAFTADDVFLVWFNKSIENWKALVGTTLPDELYYEVTHNGVKHETYIDAYMKVEHVIIPDPPPSPL
jgi:hypothetical protein